MKIFMYNENTCTRVKIYGEDVKQLFIINGDEIVKEEGSADVIIINTCNFLKVREEYFLDFLKKINERKTEKQKIAVIGCLGGVNKEDILKISNEIIIFKRDIEEIKNYFNYKELPQTKTFTITEKLSPKKKLIYLFNKLILHSKHIEYRLKRDKICYLQISRGCRGKCTYCSEKFITKLKSRPVSEIIEAVKDGINRGYKLFDLNSDDASAYGLDINSSLDELLGEIEKINSKIHFSIPEFNPQGLTKKVVEILKDKRFLYITIPIQSGSDRILDLMKRPYKIEEVINKIKIIRKNNKSIMINTHVIVGFPGETEEDFERTKDILKKGLFDRVKVFMYSERPNTEAADFPNKVDQRVKEKRRDEVLKIMKKDSLRKFSITNLILNKEQIQ